MPESRVAETSLVCVVEIPKGSRNKYEHDPELGGIKFDRLLVPVKPLGAFKMSDEKGSDDKIICVPLNDPYWNCNEQLEDLPELLRDEIEQFFSIYKDLEGKEVNVEGWRSREEAAEVIEAARERLRQSQAGTPELSVG
jgi:inorganic pyrophosphatase